MRVYAKTDLPSDQEQTVEAGFRFKDATSVMTTGEMAEALGISETHLRWLEKKGVVPSPERDTAGKRMWMKSEMETFRRVFAKCRAAFRSS
jgi:hypothetical protein